MKYRRYFLVSWIGFKDSAVPRSSGLNVTPRACDVAEVPERDEVFGIERKGSFEHRAGFVVTAGFEQRLTVDDVPAHVSGLLRQKLLTDEDGLLEIAKLPVLIRERREVTAGILVEFFSELVNSRRTGHCVPARWSADRGGRRRDNTQRRQNKSIRKCRAHLILHRRRL